MARRDGPPRLARGRSNRAVLNDVQAGASEARPNLRALLREAAANHVRAGEGGEVRPNSVGTLLAQRPVHERSRPSFNVLQRSRPASGFSTRNRPNRRIRSPSCRAHGQVQSLQRHQKADEHGRLRKRRPSMLSASFSSLPLCDGRESQEADRWNASHSDARQHERDRARDAADGATSNVDHFREPGPLALEQNSNSPRVSGAARGLHAGSRQWQPTRSLRLATRSLWLTIADGKTLGKCSEV